jgi:hypothetical protein
VAALLDPTTRAGVEPGSADSMTDFSTTVFSAAATSATLSSVMALSGVQLGSSGVVLEQGGVQLLAVKAGIGAGARAQTRTKETKRVCTRKME